MIPLGLLSMVAVAIVLERLWVLRRSKYLREDTVSALAELLEQRQYQDTRDYCRENPGPFTELVCTLIENRDALFVKKLKDHRDGTGTHGFADRPAGLGNVIKRG